MKPRILIVEDEFITAFMLREFLESRSFEVVKIVETGEDAIECALIFKPDVVLMDILLAGMIDGIEAASEIMKKTGSRIVYITANDDSSTVSRARKTGPYGFLVKPLDMHALLDLLGSCVTPHVINQGSAQTTNP